MIDHFFWLHHNGRERGVRVCLYHGVVERKNDPVLERSLDLLSDFRSHVRALRRCRVITLPELAEELVHPPDDPRPAVVLTFDDGYANNLLAREILDEAKLPMTVFVSTGGIGDTKLTWPLELRLLMLHGQATAIDAMGRSWALASRRDRFTAFKGIIDPLKVSGAGQRRQVVDEIRQQFPAGETERLLERFPSLRMLTWEEIRDMAGPMCEIGSHGVEHELHHAAQPKEIRMCELQESKWEIEQRLGLPCRFFAFPNGAFNSMSDLEVKEAGYDLAFTTEPGEVTPSINPRLLPRSYPVAPILTVARSLIRTRIEKMSLGGLSAVVPALEILQSL